MTRHSQALYDISTIRTPMAIFHGGNDTLIDAEALITKLRPVRLVSSPFLSLLFFFFDKRPAQQARLETYREPSYEHLDYLWARDVSETVYPAVIAAIASLSKRDDDDGDEAVPVAKRPRKGSRYSMGGED